MRLDTRSRAIRRAQPAGSRARLEVRGKFFFAGDEKVPLRGVTYGPFAPDADGYRYPAPEVVERDFALMPSSAPTASGPSPPAALAARPGRGARPPGADRDPVGGARLLPRLGGDHGHRPARRPAGARPAGHPAVFAYLVGNEIPPDIVRWYGPSASPGSCAELVDLIKQLAPTALVSYANFPLHRVPRARFLDFVCFNVYLHREDDFRRYLSRLQNIAGDRPLVLTEFGIDSMPRRRGRAGGDAVVAGARRVRDAASPAP